jgi:hypothetical protein
MEYLKPYVDTFITTYWTAVGIIILMLYKVVVEGHADEIHGM